MKKTWLIVIVVCVILLALIGVYFRFGKCIPHIPYPGYCYFIGSDKFLYSSPNTRIPSDKIVIGMGVVASDRYFKRIGDSIPSVDEIFGIDPSQYLCASTGEKPVEVNLFHRLCSMRVTGCGYSRSAVVCGNTYFVQQYSSSQGPEMYGPFEIN